MTLDTRRLGVDDRSLEIYRRLFAAHGFPRPLAHFQWACAGRDLPQHGLLTLDPERAPDEDGLPRAAAIYTTLAAPFKIGDTLAPAVQSMDTMTDEHYRGRGLFVSMAQAVYELARSENVAMVYGFPNGASRQGFFNNLGWTCLDPVPYLIRPLRSGYFTRRLLKRLPLPDLALPRRPQWLRLPGLAITEIEAFPLDTDALWARFSTTHQIGLVRDRAYLEWRYRSKPDCRYRIFAARRGGVLVGLAVVRELDKHGGHIGYLMELLFLPGQAAVADALVTRAVAELARAGCDAVLAWWFRHMPGYGAFAANGFVTMPERLRPIELHFGYRAFDPRFEPLLRERRNWHLSYSDSDTV